MTCPHCGRKAPRHRLGCPDHGTYPLGTPSCEHCGWYKGEHAKRCYITKRHLLYPDVALPRREP